MAGGTGTSPCGSSPDVLLIFVCLSGLTPHLQLIKKILKTPGDSTQISLIDSNHSFSDILLYDELIKYAKERPNQFKLWFTLSHKPDDREWLFSEGHLDRKMMEEHFFHPDGNKVGSFL